MNGKKKRIKKKTDTEETYKKEWEGEDDLLESLDELDKPVFVEDILPFNKNDNDDDFYENW